MSTTKADVRVDVVIAGGGPTGLLLANLLTRSGVRCLVVEPSTEIDLRPRGVMLHAAALEILEGLGLLECVLESGLRQERISFYTRNGGTFHAEMTGFDSVIDGYVNIPQPDLESILQSALNASGGRVTRGVRYVEHSDYGDHVTVRTDRDEVVDCAVLVGCDGANSSVRKHLGVALSGTSQAWSYLLLEGRPIDVVPQQESAMYIGDRGVASLLPLPGGRIRVAGPIAPGVRPDDGSMDRSAWIANMIDDLGFGERLRLSHVDRAATYTAHERLADRLVSGRVALAGDAGHLNPPAGGQAIGTGFVDALALAWRIVTGLRSGTLDKLLPEYQTERRDAAREVLASTRVLGLIGRMRDATSDKAREDIRRDLAQYAEAWSQVYPGVVNGRSSYRLEPGARVPTRLRVAPFEASTRLLDSTLDLTACTLLTGMSDGTAPAADRECRRLGLPPVERTVTVTIPPGRSVWPDPDCALLVRPDRIVAAVVPQTNAPQSFRARSSRTTESLIRKA